jgi:hypothetical protein
MKFMNLSETIIEEITDNLDKRRQEITNLRRVLQNHVNKPLEVTVVRMAIPLLYANWEGYVKEVCQLYLEYIEKSGTITRELRADLLGYLWTSFLKPLTGGLNFERKKAIAELALYCMDNCVEFADSEKNINTKSNLNFAILEEISRHLCLNISTLEPWKHHLNVLVNLRNNIAHGSFPSSMNYEIFEESACSLMALMESFENVIVNTLLSHGFRIQN